jgi:hypothetical protein
LSNELVSRKPVSQESKVEAILLNNRGEIG